VHKLEPIKLTNTTLNNLNTYDIRRHLRGENNNSCGGGRSVNGFGQGGAIEYNRTEMVKPVVISGEFIIITLYI
jgi:hypothetical protein